MTIRYAPCAQNAPVQHHHDRSTWRCRHRDLHAEGAGQKPTSCRWARRALVGARSTAEAIQTTRSGSLMLMMAWRAKEQVWCDRTNVKSEKNRKLSRLIDFLRRTITPCRRRKSGQDRPGWAGGGGGDTWATWVDRWNDERAHQNRSVDEDDDDPRLRSLSHCSFMLIYAPTDGRSSPPTTPAVARSAAPRAMGWAHPDLQPN